MEPLNSWALINHNLSKEDFARQLLLIVSLLPLARFQPAFSPLSARFQPPAPLLRDTPQPHSTNAVSNFRTKENGSLSRGQQ